MLNQLFRRPNIRIRVLYKERGHPPRWCAEIVLIGAPFPSSPVTISHIRLGSECACDWFHVISRTGNCTYSRLDLAS